MGVFQHGRNNHTNGAKLLAISALAALAVAGISCTAHASLVASDNAGNSPYAVNSSFSGLNGGNGFGAWSVTNNGGGNFISSDNWGSITPWFDIFNEGGSQTTATRSINNTLSAGDTLSFSFVLNSAQSGASVGFYLGDASDAGLFTFYQNGNDSTEGYVVDANGTTNGVGVGYNFQSVDQMAFTLTSATTYNFYVNNTLAHSGTISNATGGISQLNFFDNNGGGGSDVQFTNLSITALPLPASLSLLLLGCAGLVTLRLTRRRTIAKA